MSITAVILAGGQGSRMGGLDKGWIGFQGQPLILHLLPQLAAQVEATIISANRNLDAYAALGMPVVRDLRPDYAGPLAGIEAALHACDTEWLLTCPVDTLNVPINYAQRMHAAGASVVLHGGRVQPVFTLIPRRSLSSLRRFLDAGERKAGLWVEREGLTQVAFDDVPQAFANLNDWQAMQRAQQ